MIRFLVTALLAGLVFLPARAAEKPLPGGLSEEDIRQERDTFATLMGKLEAGDTDIDYTDLRLSYPFTQEYNPYGGDTPDRYRRGRRLFEAGSYTEARETPQSVLDDDFFNLYARYYLRECMQKSGDTAGAEREFSIITGLVSSIFMSGDAMTKETAITAVTLSEQYFVLNEIGFSIESQSFDDSSGRMIERFEGTVSETGEKRTAYFDTSLMLVGASLNRRDAK